MGKIEKALIIILISVGILGTSFMIGMGIKESIEKKQEEDSISYNDSNENIKVKTLRR